MGKILQSHHYKSHARGTKVFYTGNYSVNGPQSEHEIVKSTEALVTSALVRGESSSDTVGYWVGYLYAVWNVSAMLALHDNTDSQYYIY